MLFICSFLACFPSLVLASCNQRHFIPFTVFGYLRCNVSILKPWTVKTKLKLQYYQPNSSWIYALILYYFRCALILMPPQEIFFNLEMRTLKTEEGCKHFAAAFFLTFYLASWEKLTFQDPISNYSAYFWIEYCQSLLFLLTYIFLAERIHRLLCS